jgi:hypothetical protein
MNFNEWSVVPTMSMRGTKGLNFFGTVSLSKEIRDRRLCFNFENEPILTSKMHPLEGIIPKN